MGAVIATLFDLELQPVEMDLWRDHTGVTLAIDPKRAGVIPLVTSKIKESCVRMVWRKAGEHYLRPGHWGRS